MRSTVLDAVVSSITVESRVASGVRPALSASCAFHGARLTPWSRADSSRRERPSRRPGFLPRHTARLATPLLASFARRFGLPGCLLAGLLAAAAPASAQTVRTPGSNEANLTARFENVPANHDGSSVFRLRLAFSEEVFDGSERFDKNQAIQDALVVNGGVVTGRRRVDRNEFDEWWFKVAPSGNGAVTVSLPAQTDCGAADAVCTPDGAALESPVSATVPGPVSQIREVSITAANSSMTRNVTADSSQVTEGMAAEFTLTRTGSLADALTVDVSVTETGTMLSSTVPKAVTFNANSPTAELRVETEDDEVAEPASAVSAALAAGSGYSVDAGAAAATVTVEDDDAAPVVQAAAIVTVPENTTAVAALTATDDDTPVADLGWSIVGGADAAMFAVSAGGDLAFTSAKDFEAPDDADKDGDYEVTVRVTDGANAVDAALTVRLADVDDVSPVLTGANVNGDALTLTFGEPLDGGSVPAPSAFSATVDGAARGVSDVSMSSSSVTLTLASAVAAGETVTVGYTVPTGANARPLRDVAGNRVASFADEAAANATVGVTAELDDLPADTSTTGRVAVGGSLQGSIQAGTAQNATDEDWIAVSMVKGQVYVIDLEGADTGQGTLSDPKINGVADPNGWHGGASDDNGGEGKNSRVLFTAVSSGDHYIKVAGSDAASVGTYRLSVARFDGDQLATTATTATVAVGGSVDGSIDETRDMDAFKVALVAGDSYKIDMQGNGFSTGLRDPIILGLLDPDGSTIANTSASGGSAVVPTRLRYTATATGTHVILVAGGVDRGIFGHSGSTGAYTLSVDEIDVTDDYTADTSTTGRLDFTSSTTSAGVTATGEIETVGDVDWFSIRLDAGQAVFIRIERESFGSGAGYLMHPKLAGIYGSNSQAVADSSHSGSTAIVLKLFRPDEAGTYYVAVASARSGETGGYEVKATPGPANADDFTHDDQTSGRVAVGGSVTGDIEWNLDHDWFAVDLVAETRYRVELEGAATSKGTLTTPALFPIRRPDGGRTWLSDGQDAGEGYNDLAYFTPGQSGTHYVVVGSADTDTGVPGSAGPGGIGTYTLSVTEDEAEESTEDVAEESVEDDLTNDTSTTGTVSVGGSASGEIETAGDEDWFRVELVAGKSYAFFMTGSWQSDGYTLTSTEIVGLHDSGGGRIANTSSDEQQDAGFNASVTYRAPRTGTHYLAVKAGHPSDGVGTYGVSVVEQPEDDFSADTDTTGAVAVGGSSTGLIEAFGDADWFAVQLFAGTTYLFNSHADLSHPDYPIGFWSPRDFDLEGLYDDEGGRVVAGGPSFSYTASDTGTYYVSVNSVGYGPYSVSVEELETAPVLSGASVDGSSLTLTFSEALDQGSTPGAGAFAVSVDRAARGISDVSVSGSSVTLTLASAVASGETVAVGYTVPTGTGANPLQDVAGNPAAGFSDQAVTNDTPASNSTPTGLPTISGTARVGEALTADSSGIADADGLTKATFAWQWVSNDGNSDGDIPNATSETYTLTAAEAGKTIKVRVTFTDDDETEEVLVSEPTAAVNSVPTGLPAVSGTPRVGETLAASASGIADMDGLTNAAFAWQWIANDGTSDADISGATGAEYTLTSAEAGKTIKVRVTFTDDGETEEVLVSEPTAAVNSVPTGLPAISGTAQVGETLAASASGIADMDGLTNAAFAWHWIANDGTSDADIAGATGAEYTLTSAEAGKTIKVRATFTDDGGTEETLVSEATAAVTLALPSVSVAAVSSPVTEGTAASFTLRRTGDTASALTVAVSVTEEGAVVSATPASSVTFATGSAQTALSVATVDDGVAEADARVTVAVTAGSGYLVDNGSGSARVDVYDNDAVVSTPVRTLWTSTLVWQGDYGAGWVNANEEDFSSPGWSEDGEDYRIWYIAYGSSKDELWVRVDPDMGAGGIPAPGELTLEVGHVTVDAAGAMAEFARGNIAIVRGIGQSWAVGEQVQVRLTRTTAGETTVTGPGVSVADAQVQEAEGAALAFSVTLAEAQTSAVSVRYATSDGTATAGADYEAVSGALRFAPGETAKTISVPVLNDAHDDDGETMTLTLSSPFGAQIADGTATGTITNSDPLQKMWLSRFGRTVAIQMIDALEGRFAIAPDASPRMTMTVAGQSVDLARIGDDNVLAETMTGLARAFGAPGAPAANDNDPFARHGFGEAGNGAGVSAPARSVTGRDLLLGSSFHFTTGEASGLGGAMTGWGKVLSGGSSGSFGGGLSFASETATGVLGMDWERDRLLVGVALSRSVEKGSASFGPTDVQYDIEGSLSMVTPYLRVRAGDRLSFWSAVGSGSGSMSLSRGSGWQTADVTMRLAAAGGRAELLRPGAAGGLALALKTDAFFVRSESARVSTPGVGNLAAATGDASRLRAVLEGSRAFALSDGGALEPSLSLGLRHDGGDAETGSGVEIGAGLTWSAPAAGLTSDLRLYGLAAHEAGGYDEWGASGSLRMVPGPTGRGLSLSMTPSWGARGETGRLWNAAPGGLAGDGGSEQPGMRFDTELGYGLPLSGGVTGTPYAGFGFGEAGARDYRLGWRFASDRLRSLTLGIETTRREAVNDNGAGGRPEHGVTLRAGLRW